MSENPRVSIVIPVKNGFPEIKDCIDSILKQSVPVHEIIAIDSGSADETVKYLRTISQVRLIQIPPEEFNHGATRNLGWQHASGDFVAYTVQDAAAVDENWLAELLKGFADDSDAAVCGKQIVAHDKNSNPVRWFKPVTVPQLRKYSLKTGAFDRLPPEDKVKMCSWDNVNAIYRRAVLEKLGFPYAVYGEDMAWAKKALLAGHTIVYNPAARVYHYHHEDAEYTFRRCFTTMYFRHKEFNYTYDRPAFRFSSRLRLIKILLKNLGPDLKSVRKWYKYNTSNFAAFARAHTVFMQLLREGDAALESKHEELCGRPPIPLKVK